MLGLEPPMEPPLGPLPPLGLLPELGPVPELGDPDPFVFDAEEVPLGLCVLLVESFDGIIFSTGGGSFTVVVTLPTWTPFLLTRIF